MYSESLNSGQDYRELPNVIAINIVDFDYLPGENFHACFHLREDADTSIILSPVLEIHFVNMVKWRRQREKDIEHNPLHRWLTWFDEKSPPELIEEVLRMDTAIRKAYEVFGFANQQELYAWDLKRRQEKAHWDMVSRLNYAREEGEEIGQKKGEENKALEIARKMKEMGDPVEKISAITGLSFETINGLAP